jgi:hypothetical protein
MTPRKPNRAFAIAGIMMPVTRAHIERQIEPQREMLAGLTSHQLAGVIRDALTKKFVDRPEFMHYKDAGVARDYYYDETSHVTQLHLDYTERT